MAHESGAGGGGGGEGRRYNPTTGRWETVSGSSGSSSSGSANRTSSSSGGSRSSSGSSGGGGGGGSSAKKKKKKSNEIEINVLKAEAGIVVTPATFALEVGDTVTVDGVGSHLSGNYLITDKVLSITSTEGVTVTLTVSKLDFTKSLKTVTADSVSQLEKDGSDIYLTTKAPIRKGAGTKYDTYATGKKGTFYPHVPSKDTSNFYAIVYNDVYLGYVSKKKSKAIMALNSYNQVLFYDGGK